MENFDRGGDYDRLFLGTHLEEPVGETMDEIRKSKGPLLAVVWSFAISLLVFHPVFGQSSTPKGGHASPPVSCDPKPPLDFNLTLSSFVPSSSGGLATIKIDLFPHTLMGDAVISGRLEQGLRFSDGSDVKTWNLPIPTGNKTSFTEEIQVPADGTFVIILEAESFLPNGIRIHRSRGLKIYAGVVPPRPTQRGRVLEFQGTLSPGSLQ